MKIKFVLILIFISISSRGQYMTKNRIKSIDTIQLKSFEEKKVVHYSFENVKFVVPKKDFLDEIKDLHRFYEEIVNDTMYDNSEKEFYISGFKKLDSLYRKLETNSEKPINISHNEINALDLHSLNYFSKFMDSGNCAVFDKNGDRQYMIIRKTILWNYNTEVSFEGKEYFFFEKEVYFFTDMLWID